MATLKSRVAIDQVARGDLSADELGGLLDSVVMSW
jgi:hypothetical protein